MNISEILKYTEYRPPKTPSLPHNLPIKRALHGKRIDSFKELPALANDSHFKPVDLIPTKRGAWFVYDRQNYLIPNFPAEHTVTYSTLAWYEDDEIGNIDAAVLRQSTKPYQYAEVLQDLDIMAKYYLEMQYNPLPIIALYYLTETCTRKKIPALNQYFGGENVLKVLQRENEHVKQVATLKNVFALLT